MKCANILAERDLDGQWTVAKAVFSGIVTGMVLLVRINNTQHKSFLKAVYKHTKYRTFSFAQCTSQLFYQLSSEYSCSTFIAPCQIAKLCHSVNVKTYFAEVMKCRVVGQSDTNLCLF